MTAWQATVTQTALVVGCICFAIYVFECLVAVFRKTPEEAKQIAVAARNVVPNAAVTGADFAKILEAVAKIGETLTKAGPALTSLIGAVLFFAIAMVSSGSLRSIPQTVAPPDAASGNAADANGGAAKTDDMPTVKKKLPPPTK